LQLKLFEERLHRCNIQLERIAKLSKTEEYKKIEMTVFGDDPGLNAQETYKELLKQLEDWNRLVDNKAQQAKIPNLKLKSTLCSLLAENLRIILNFKNFQLQT
jgi:hypothetical protein